MAFDVAPCHDSLMNTTTRHTARHDLYTMSAEKIAAKVIGRTIRVQLHRDDLTPYFREGKVERVEGGRTVVRFDDEKWSYGPSGRITVR